MTPTSRYTPTTPPGGTARPTTRLSFRVELPRPANFVRSPKWPPDTLQEVAIIDVGDLNNEQLEQLATAIKLDFLRNARERRRQKRQGA